jgi:hypothetical protein
LHTHVFDYSALAKIQNKNINIQKCHMHLILRSGKVYLVVLQILSTHLLNSHLHYDHSEIGQEKALVFAGSAIQVERPVPLTQNSINSLVE